jgi:hypothetical protein
MNFLRRITKVTMACRYCFLPDVIHTSVLGKRAECIRCHGMFVASPHAKPEVRRLYVRCSEKPGEFAVAFVREFDHYKIAALLPVVTTTSGAATNNTVREHVDRTLLDKVGFRCPFCNDHELINCGDCGHYFCRGGAEYRNDCIWIVCPHCHQRGKLVYGPTTTVALRSAPTGHMGLIGAKH